MKREVMYPAGALLHVLFCLSLISPPTVLYHAFVMAFILFPFLLSFADIYSFTLCYVLKPVAVEPNQLPRLDLQDCHEYEVKQFNEVGCGECFAVLVIYI